MCPCEKLEPRAILLQNLGPWPLVLNTATTWLFQRGLSVFLGFCWWKEMSHAKLVFSRKNHSLEMLKDFLECSQLLRTKPNTLLFYTEFENQSIKETWFQVKSSISFASLVLFFLSFIRGKPSNILTKKPEFYPAHPSSSESTTK